MSATMVGTRASFIIPHSNTIPYTPRYLERTHSVFTPGSWTKYHLMQMASGKHGCLDNSHATPLRILFDVLRLQILLSWLMTGISVAHSSRVPKVSQVKINCICPRVVQIGECYNAGDYYYAPSQRERAPQSAQNRYNHCAGCGPHRASGSQKPARTLTTFIVTAVGKTMILVPWGYKGLELCRTCARSVHESQCYFM
jgi:hypothetical protein